MIRGWREEFVKRESARKVCRYWVLCDWEGLGGLTCDFWAENGKRKKQILRLRRRMTTKKQRPRQLAGCFARWNWWLGETHISKSRCGAPALLSGLRCVGLLVVRVEMSGTACCQSRDEWDCLLSESRYGAFAVSEETGLWGYAGRLRNFFAAAVMSTTNRISRRVCATLNGVSVPVGASAWIAGTFAKSCAIRTKILK
jgi:hypothetical protein